MLSSFQTQGSPLSWTQVTHISLASSLTSFQLLLRKPSFPGFWQHSTTVKSPASWPKFQLWPYPWLVMTWSKWLTLSLSQMPFSTFRKRIAIVLCPSIYAAVTTEQHWLDNSGICLLIVLEAEKSEIQDQGLWWGLHARSDSAKRISWKTTWQQRAKGGSFLLEQPTLAITNWLLQ